MEVVAWFVTGLLGVAVAANFVVLILVARIDALGDRLKGRIDALTARIDASS
jgi:hypothetical protein